VRALALQASVAMAYAPHGFTPPSMLDTGKNFPSPAGHDGLNDLAEETGEPVPGRATMKWQSKNIVEKGMPVHRGRAKSGGIDLPSPTMPPQGQPNGQKPRWELTPDLMNQPWGEPIVHYRHAPLAGRPLPQSRHIEARSITCDPSCPILRKRAP